jgi:hypothetical protein
MTSQERDLSLTVPRICGTCQGVVALAVTFCASSFYLGWICSRCLVAEQEGLLDVVGVYTTRQDAECDLLTEEYYASLDQPDLDPSKH